MSRSIIDYIAIVVVIKPEVDTTISPMITTELLKPEEPVSTIESSIPEGSTDSVTLSETKVSHRYEWHRNMSRFVMKIKPYLLI